MVQWRKRKVSGLVSWSFLSLVVQQYPNAWQNFSLVHIVTPMTSATSVISSQYLYLLLLQSRLAYCRHSKWQRWLRAGDPLVIVFCFIFSLLQSLH